ncbi:MAG: ParB N-terminal domain-containing protein, partial [Chloroflexi bacterium]|nr:ParB N-terminal domain-containing protein [Chloroflexota bacterium]
MVSEVKRRAGQALADKKKMENAARNVRICEMFAEGGRTHQQIGKEVGVSRFVVRNALAEGIEHWQEWERKAIDAGVPQLGEPEPSGPLSGAITMLPLDAIAPNPWQPRDDMDEEALILLSDDIYRNGLLSPILVRETGDSGRYELVYGQRRLEAFRMLDATDWDPPDGDIEASDKWVAEYYADGVTRIPAIVRTMNSEEVILASLSENMAREDLTWLEETRAFKQALDANVGLSQRRLAGIVGTSPTNMSDRIRMLQLPSAILDMVGEGKIAWTAARELLGFVSPKVFHHSELNYLAKVLPKCREIKDYGRIPTEDLRKYMLRAMGHGDNANKWEHLGASIRDMYIGDGGVYKRPPVMDPSAFIAANPGYIHTLPDSWGRGTTTWTSRGYQWRAAQNKWLEEQGQAREQAARVEREETQANDGDNWKDRE